jgi:hypothetical protein
VARQERPSQRDLPGRTGDRRPVGQPRRQPADEDLVGRQAVAPGERDRDELQRERAAGPDRRVRRHPAGEVRADHQRARPNDDRDAGSRQEPLREGVIGERPIRRDVAVDDLDERVRPGDVDPLEARDHGALWRPERRGDHPETDVAAALGGGLVEGAAEPAERPLAAGRGLVERVGRGGRAGSGPPDWQLGSPLERSAPLCVGTSTSSRSAPASTAARASSRAPARSGSPIAAPIHGLRGSPRTSISSERAVRFASIRSMAAATSRAASSSAIARRSGSRRSAPHLRSTARADVQRQSLRRRHSASHREQEDDAPRAVGPPAR